MLQCWPAVGDVTVTTGLLMSIRLAVNVRFEAMTKLKVGPLVTMPLPSVQLTKLKPGLAVAVMK